MHRSQAEYPEQSLLSDVEIRERKELLKIDALDVTLLAGIESFFQEKLEDIVTELLAIIRTNQGFRQALPKDVLLQDIAELQRGYLRGLFGGEYGSEYVDNRRRIGREYLRLGVEPPLFSAMGHRLRSLLETHAADLGHDRLRLQRIVCAIDKLMQFDSALMYDTYIEGLRNGIEYPQQEVERQALELEDLIRQRSREIESLTRQDPLTGMLRRREFISRLETDLHSMKRNGQPLCLACLKIDKFGQLCNRMGFLHGDSVKCSLAESTFAVIRDQDNAGWTGVSELCISMPQTSELAGRMLCVEICQLFALRHPEQALLVRLAVQAENEFCAEDFLRHNLKHGTDSVKRKEDTRIPVV
ncbi:MAG: protoglobin domain-containing protein [bacterium]